VRIDGGLTLDGGRVRLRGVHSSYDSPSLESGDHLLLRGTGEIIFDGSGSESRVQGIQSTHIEAGVTVRTGNAGGVLGAPDTPNSNAGTILATRAGASITMRGEWTNDGVVRAPAGGGTLRLRGRFVNRSVLDSSDTVNDGTLSQRGGSAFAGRLSGSGSVEVTGGQSLSAEYVRQSSLGVDAEGVVSLIGDAEATSVLGTLSLAEGSTLDVGRSRLIVKAVAGESAAAALARVAALVASARNAAAGRWLGAGITSSAARGEELRGLATIDGRDGEIGGQPVAAGDVVVAYTWNGDANVDGKVDADDYFRIDGGFLSRPANPLYTNGDFDYDGAINADDYFLIDSAFLGQTTPTPSPSHAVSVPEPGVAVMLLAFLACAHGCRARTRSERDGRYACRM
jgi:hypothetical protein